MDYAQYKLDAAGQTLEELLNVYEQNYAVIGWLRDYSLKGGGEPTFGLSTVTTEQLMSDEGGAQLDRWLGSHSFTFKVLDEYPPDTSRSVQDLRELVPSIRMILDSVLDDLSRVVVGKSQDKRPRRE